MGDATFIRATDLLRRLEPAVRPGFAGPSAPASIDATATLDTQPFEALLAGAFRGEIHSDQPLHIACDIQPPLSDEQVQRLSLAADRALAGGANMALLMLDGRGVIVDVRSRAITGELTATDAPELLRIDAAMVVASADQDDAGRGSPFAGLPMRSLQAAPARLAAHEQRVTR